MSDNGVPKALALAPEVADALVDALTEPLAAAVAQALAQQLPAPGVLLNAEQAGHLLGVPASWIRAEARANRIPHVRLGKYSRFDATELEAWWRSRAYGPWRKHGQAAAQARRTRLEVAA